MCFIPHNVATSAQAWAWVSHKEEWGAWDTADWTEVQEWAGGKMHHCICRQCCDR